MKVRVEYEPIPIRRFAVQCPHCMSWLNGYEAMKGKDFSSLRYKHQIYFRVFKCLNCKTEFGGTQHGEKIDIKEVYSEEECYKDCIGNKEFWD